MRTSFRFRSVIIISSAVLSILFIACPRKNDKDKQNTVTFSTWEKEGKGVDPSFNFPQMLEALPDNFYPWTGTVSHHFLTDPLIDSWFREIKECRDVKHFFIISPSHYGLSTQSFSITDGRWECKDKKYVYSNQKYAQKLCKSLNVKIENQVFYPEHGVSTLAPYISKYFPDADIVAIAIHGEPPVNPDYCQELYQALKPFFDDKGKKENFLIVSSDFSHHGNPEQTAAKDKNSQRFFDNPVKENYITAVCDNRPAIYVMASLFDQPVKKHLLYHTNSYQISGMDKDDITSYFFTLFE